MSVERPGGRVRVVRSRRPESLTALAEIDQRLLGVLCTHRVVTQEQLCRLFARVPERTLRYRTRRLHDLGLAGRSRPYREQGSAPNHHWPTRRADCLVRGEPLPRGGERREPNPLFLAHAAALTDLFVTLATEAHHLDLELRTFRREEHAREPFNEYAKSRSLAPDALIVLRDRDGRTLRAFVEIDLGMMSHARLRQKAAVYLAYAKTRAREARRRAFMPALLFLTTSTSRSYRFLENLAGMLDHAKYNPSPYGLTAAAGAVALDARSLLGDPCLADIHGNSHLLLLDVLNDARAPYERAQAAQREREEAEADELRVLLADPEAIRERLRENHSSFRRYLDGLEPAGQAAVDLLLTDADLLGPDGRAALHSIGRDLDANLLTPRDIPSPSPTTLGEVKLLTDRYRHAQERLLGELISRYGEGPSLRAARRAVQAGSLLAHGERAQLSTRAERDLAGRHEQHERRVVYEEWRKRAGRQRALEEGPFRLLAHPRERFHPQLDRQYLRVCRSCKETIYPGLLINDGYGGRHPGPGPCHYCGALHNYHSYGPNQHASTGSEAQ